MCEGPSCSFASWDTKATVGSLVCASIHQVRLNNLLKTQSYDRIPGCRVQWRTRQLFRAATNGEAKSSSRLFSGPKHSAPNGKRILPSALSSILKHVASNGKTTPSSRLSSSPKRSASTLPTPKISLTRLQDEDPVDGLPLRRRGVLLGRL